MAIIKKTYDKNHYQVKDAKCLGRKCLGLGEYQSYGYVGGARTNKGSTPCCVNRAYHGCPDHASEHHQFDDKLAKQRKKDGMKVL